MLDFARNVKLSLTETLRRSAIKVAGGAVMAVGIGFLLAALWSYLANDLGWGSTLASLAVGGGFLLIGVIAIMIGGRQKHPMPTADDLKNEVQARVTLAADAAVDRARTEASKFVGMAESRVNSLIDTASDRAGKIVGDAERSAYGFARDTARKVGLTNDNIEAVQETAREYADRAQRIADSNVGSMAKLVGAFAVGVTIASKLHDWRFGDELSDNEIADIYDRTYRDNGV